MDDNVARYLSLLEDYLDKQVTPERFQSMYLYMLKHEPREFDQAVFLILDKLFGDVDSFVPDAKLRVDLEKQTPGFYLDEQALRHEVSDAYKELVRLRERSDF